MRVTILALTLNEIDGVQEILPDIVGEGFDLVIGSRYKGDAKSDDDELMTGFGNLLFTKTVNVLHRASYTDCMVIYRAFRRELIWQLDLDKDESYEFPERLFRTIISWEPLMSVRAARRTKRVDDIGVGEPPRIGGNRKLQIFRWGAAYYFQFRHEALYGRRTVSERTGSPSGFKIPD